MKTSLTALLLLALLGGCATGQWTHAHNDAARFERDRAECNYEAEKASSGGRTMADRVGDRVYIVRSCLQLRGYYLVQQ